MDRRITNDGGFTLVEVLCVLALIAVMTSVVILNVKPPKSKLEVQATKLTGQLNAMAQDGLISGSVSAAGFSKDGYALYTFENSEWNERASGEWEGSYRMTFTRASAKLDMPKKIEPTIMFQPTGLSTRFELTLSDRDAKYALRTTGDGHVQLEKSLP